MTEPAPDYATMSGTEFRRACGADPEKWATAFDQRVSVMSAPPQTKEERIALWTEWFTDAMRAAQQAMPKPVV